MNESKDNEFWIPAFDELERELTRVAAAEPRSRLSRRVRRGGLALIGAMLVAVPVAFAVEGAFDGGGPDVEVLVPGETVEVDGERQDCPVDEGLVQEVGFDPCEAFTGPAVPPLSEQQPEGSGPAPDDSLAP